MNRFNYSLLMNNKKKLLNTFRRKKLPPDEKIFCIGHNKTGTTSLETALFDLGYKMGNQSKAQNLLSDYSAGLFQSTIKFCEDADAFQDAPFSYHLTYQFLDKAYPKAKFILTIRDSSEVWYHSLIKFHSKKFGINNALPTINDLKQAKRSSKRTVWDNFLARYKDIDPLNPYDKNVLINYYESHNKDIINYFRKKNNLLIINLSHDHSYQDFCSFIGENPLYTRFPWINRS